MTGAGSAQVGFTMEQEFGVEPLEPDWKQPGADVTVDGPSIDRSAERKRNPDDPRSGFSRPGDFIGTVTVSFSLAWDVYHDLIFADGGTALPDEFTAAPSSRWFFGADLVDGDSDVVTVGTVVTDAQINYNRGEDITGELTLEFADIDEDPTPPDAIDQAPLSDVYVFHGADLDIGPDAQTLLQSATLSLGNLARMRRGQSQTAHDAVVGAIEADLSTGAIVTEPDQLELAYGGREDAGTLDEETITLSFENGAANTIAYQVDAQPINYAWSDLVGDTDLTEPIDWHVHSVEAI